MITKKILINYFQMSKYYIKVDNPFSILLDKQHKVLRSKHPEIRLIPRENELEILTSSEIKEEALLARRGDKDHIIPLVDLGHIKCTGFKKDDS